MNKLVKELQTTIKQLENLRDDYDKKDINSSSSFCKGAKVACESGVDKIKRAIARAYFVDEVKILQEWIGVLCEAYKHGNTVTYDAIAEQVVYELFKDKLLKEGESNETGERR